MLKKTVLSALLLGAALVTAGPSQAVVVREHPNGRVVVRPGYRPHARFAFRHDFRHFTPVEHRWWVGGRWRHMWWHGRYGWWWGVGGSWYWYPAPVYPYPVEVSPTYYYDDYDDYGDYDDEGGAPSDQGGYGTWYHCSNPEGYYPYVKECRGGWEQVPAQPPGAGMQGGPGGEDQGGPGYDQGGPGYDQGPSGPNDQSGPDDQNGPDDEDQGPPPPPH